MSESRKTRRKSQSDTVRQDVQGLRAIAVLAVVIFHASDFLPGGFVGVDIFFVISGFVILNSLLREHARTGRISLRKFYVRRFKRLVPALALVVFTTLVMAAFLLSPLGPQQTLALTAIAAVFSLANVAIASTTGDYFDAPAELNPLLHTWSLSVEEQFYLVFPIAVVIGLSLARGRLSGPWTVVSIGTALSLGALLIAPSIQSVFDSPLLGFYSPIVRAWEFGVGALIALWLFQRQKKFGRRVSALLFVAGIALLTAAISPLVLLGEFPGPITALPVVGTALTILGGSGQPFAGRQLLSGRPLVLIGDWSYSIYLWHWPFVSLSAILWPDNQWASSLAVVISFGPAVASYYLLENRLRFTPFPSYRAGLLVAGVTLLTPISGAGALWAFAESLVPRATTPVPAAGPAGAAPTDAEQEGVIDPEELGRVADERPPGYELGCHGPPNIAETLSVCSWDYPNDLEAGSPVYLIGDSNAAHFTEGLRLAAEAEKRDLKVATASNCPLTVGAVPKLGSEDKCERWQQLVIEYLAESRSGTVVLAGTDGYWLGTTHAIAGAGDAIAEDEETKVALLRDATADTASTLKAFGHEVILVQTVPQWTGENEWSLDSCSLVETLEGCVEEQSLETHFSNAGPVILALERAAGASGARTVDFVPQICPDEVCSTAQAGQYVYRDSSHITNSFSRALVSSWQEKLYPPGSSGDSPPAEGQAGGTG